MLWDSNMLQNRLPESTISIPGTLGGPRGVPNGRPARICLVLRCRFWGNFWYQNLLNSESISGLEKSELWEMIFIDFDLIWKPRPSPNVAYMGWIWCFSFLSLSAPERAFGIPKSCKITSKWAPKRLQNQVENEVRNRDGFGWRLRLDFLGFEEALRRVPGSQWEGKRGG